MTMPKVTLTFNNDPRNLLLNSPIRCLLAAAPLPEAVFRAFIARLGPAGTVAACGNPFISEQLWVELYASTPWPAHTALLAHRILSDAQRAHVVDVAGERAVAPLRLLVAQLDEVELAKLAARRLCGESARTVFAAQLDRMEGVPARRSPDGRPMIDDDGWATAPLAVPAADPATAAAGVAELTLDPFARRARARAAGAWLCSHLGSDVAAFDVVADRVQAGAVTWADAVGSRQHRAAA